jgi:hypothetical protein
MIILVGGTKSGSGKTTFISAILKAFPNTFSVIKVTPTDEMPEGIETELSVLNKKGKDTAAFLKSSAKTVIWVHGKRGHIEQLIRQAMKKVEEPVIIEGNSAAQYITNATLFFIKKENAPVEKQSSVFFLKNTDYIVINSIHTENTAIKDRIIHTNLLKESENPSNMLKELINSLTKSKK